MSIVHSALVDALLAGNRAELESLIAPDVVFHSPVRSYRDRRDVVHLLSMIGPLLGATEVTHSWTAGASEVSWIRSAQPEGALDGLLTEARDGSGQVSEVALMLRPVSVMMPTIKRMGAALNAEPLPSKRSTD